MLADEQNESKIENQRIIHNDDDVNYDNIEPEIQLKVRSSNVIEKTFSISSFPFIDAYESLQNDSTEKESASNKSIVDSINSNFELKEEKIDEINSDSTTNPSPTHSKTCSFNDESFEYIDMDEIRANEKKLDASTSFTSITRLISNKNDIAKNNNTTDLSLTSYIMQASTNKSCEKSFNEENLNMIKDDNTIDSNVSILNQDAEDTNNNNNMIEFDEINKEEKFAIKNEDNKELVEIPVFLNNDVCKISLIEKNNEKVMNEVKIIQNDLENNKTLNCFEKLYSFEKSDQNTNKKIIEKQIVGSNYVSKIKTFNDVIVMNCHENKLNISENVIDTVVQHVESQKIINE